MDGKQWQYVEHFLEHIQLVRRLSVHTVKGYRRDLTCVAEFCNDQNVAVWQDLKPHHVRAFAARSYASGLGPRSIQRRLSGLRSFLNYLVRENLLSANPADDILAPKAPRTLPNTLDIEQMGRMIEMPAADTIGIRDRAILELLYSSGLRLAELIDLDPVDVDLVEGIVRVTGKGNKTRLVPVGAKAGDAINNWLRIRFLFLHDWRPRFLRQELPGLRHLVAHIACGTIGITAELKANRNLA